MSRQPNTAPPTLAMLGAASSRFFRWWADELASWVPSPLRLWWQEAGHLMLVAIDHDRATFLRPTGDRLDEVHAVALGGGRTAAESAQLDPKLRKMLGGDIQWMLCLAPEQVLRRSVSLPQAVEENLRQTLAFELDRVTPFKPEQAHFDFRLAARHADRKQIVVDLAVAPRAALDKLVQQATAMGLPVGGAVLADDVLKHGSACLNLLPAGVRRVRRTTSRLWSRLALALLAFALLLALLAIPLWQKRAAAISLLEPLAQAKQAAHETDALRDRLSRLTEEHNTLPDRKWDGYSALRALDELSKRLPDDTFLLQFDYDGKSIQIQGESASSSSLAETLEASPFFKEVGFKSQLTKIPTTTADRFHLAASLETTERSQPRPAEAVTGASSATASPAAPGTAAPPPMSAPAASPMSSPPAAVHPKP